MTTRLPFLDLADPAFSTRSPQVNAARDASWCARTPYGLAVLRHREVGTLLRDKRLRQGSHAWPETNGLKGSFGEFWQRSIISTEGNRHRLLRGIAMPALSSDFIESLIPEFDRNAERLATAIADKGECEFMADFSVPFAGQAICILLGLPVERWEEISHDASDLGLAMGVDCKKHETRFNAACDRLMGLSDQLIGRVRNGDDNQSYVARLVANFDAAGCLEEQALRDLVVISIFGGVDTTRSQLGFAMALFAEHQDQWQALRADPELATATVEEVIRAWPTTTWATREAVEDFTFSDIKIAKGTTLHMLVHASARDPDICDDPGFDITADRKIHFGFGGGAHHCLGHLVARTDMACALRALSRKIAAFEVTGIPEYLPDSGNTSPVALKLKLVSG